MHVPGDHADRLEPMAAEIPIQGLINNVVDSIITDHKRDRETIRNNIRLQIETPFQSTHPMEALTLLSTYALVAFFP